MKCIRVSLFLFLMAGLLQTAGSHLSAQTQPGTRRVIQFSGVVVNADSLQPVPFVSVIVRNTYRGTISDYYGFFSFVAQVNDTIEFSAAGYSRSRYVIPSNLDESRYSIIQMLQRDTVVLQETVVYPWPTREQFEIAFLSASIPDDDLERARKNLAQERIGEISLSMPMDAGMNYRNTSQQFNTRLYNAGQVPMNNLLNPIAWAKFVEAWKKGDFKKK